MYFFCSRIPSRIPCNIQSSYYLQLHLALNFPDFTWYLWPWYFLEEVQGVVVVLVRYFVDSSLVFLCYFLMIRLKLCILRRKTTEIRHSHHTISRFILLTWFITTDINLDNMVEVSNVSPLYVTLYHSGTTHCAGHTSRVESYVLSPGSKVSLWIIWNSSALDICLFSPSYLFIQSFICTRNHGYLFHAWFIIQYYFILLPWPLWTLSVGPWVPLTCPIIVLLPQSFLIFWHCTMIQINLVYFLPHS